MNTKIIFDPSSFHRFLWSIPKDFDNFLDIVENLEKSFCGKLEITLVADYDPFDESNPVKWTGKIYCPDYDVKKAVKALNHFEDFYWIENLQFQFCFLVDALRYHEQSKS